MTIVSHGQAGHERRPAPSTPLVIDPAEPPLLEMVPVGPGGEALVPVLVLAGGIRICVDAFSADADAALWWYDVATTAATASLCYPAESEPAR